MRALVTSDWHLDAVTVGVRRFAELNAAVRETVEVAIAQKVDAYVFLGDLCDPDSGSSVFRCVELALSAADDLNRAGIDNVWLAGNHDVIEDGSGDTTLAPLRVLQQSHTRVVERPVTMIVGRVRWVFLPFTPSGDRYDPTETAAALLGEVAGAPCYVAGHLSIPGMVPGEETHDFGRGREVLYPYETLAAAPNVRVMMNGHYHEQAQFRPPLPGGGRGARPIVIPGSLARLTFGEECNRPCYTMVTDHA